MSYLDFPKSMILRMQRYERFAKLASILLCFLNQNSVYAHNGKRPCTNGYGPFLTGLRPTSSRGYSLTVLAMR
jgi:hypothetical protein